MLTAKAQVMNLIHTIGSLSQRRVERLKQISPEISQLTFDIYGAGVSYRTHELNTSQASNLIKHFTHTSGKYAMMMDAVDFVKSPIVRRMYR